MSFTVNPSIDHAHRRHVVGGEPMIFHCHHYNAFLQRSIQDAGHIESAPFLVGAAAEAAYGQISELTAGMDPLQALETAAEVYRWAGFGVVDLRSVTADGGTVVASSSHYGSAWLAKFGPSSSPVDLFTQGWLAGAAAAALNLPCGSFSTSQRACIATGADEAMFDLTRDEPTYPVWSGTGVGPLTDHMLHVVEEHNVDYDGIYDALVSMPIEGNEQGLIPTFGVYLTHHYANYYNRISFEFERSMIEAYGDEGHAASRPLLVEAGHVCAFNTFGGIMTSAEWDALIRPSLKTAEDWVHGMVAAVNALGWGRWQVTDVNAQQATFVMHDDYESTGYRAMYGTSQHPVSYLAEGAALGIMNLVYRGKIADRPDLTPEFYNSLFKSAENYRAECKASLAMGDDETVFQIYAP